MPRGPSGPRRRFRGTAAALAASVAALVACVPAASGATYAGMGDSYSAGVGGSNEQTNCRRADDAYPRTIAATLTGTFSFPACSGAQTEHMDQAAQGANGVTQVDFPGALDAGTQYVTMTLAINDGNIVGKMSACPASNCVGEMEALSQFWRDEVPARMTRVFAAIRAKAPNARILVAGYPRFFHPTAECFNSTGFSAEERAAINATLDVLADVTRDVTLAGGHTFVDTRRAFIGHAVCDSTAWIHGLGGGGSAYHPNPAGHAAYARLIRPAMLAMRAPGQTAGPDARFAFSSTRDGNAEVYVANADGAFPLNLTQSPAADTQPSFSPDGTQIAFASDRDGDNEIYLMSVSGGEVEQLTANTADDRQPAWSPNGEYVTYASNRDGDFEVFTASSDGTGGAAQLTTNTIADTLPDWSPDGSEIAWVRDNDVWRMNADGEGQVNLTANSATDTAPAWAPGSQKLAFASNRDGNSEIYLMGRDGSAPSRLTNNPATDAEPAFSPSGSSIAFSSTRDGNSEIYEMAAAGTGQTRRSNSPGSDTVPSRQADSTPPETAILSPGPLTNDPTPTFVSDSTEPGSTFECSVDDGAFTACPAAFTGDALGEGDHTFAVRATDPSGNTDESPASRTFTVDLTPAVTTITGGPTGLISGRAAEFTFSSDDAEATFECSLGGTAWEPCTSPKSYAALADGDHTFHVRGTDSAGNPDAAAATRSFKVEASPPETSITPVPAVTNDDPLTVSFSADELGSTFECRVDNGPWELCTNPQQLSLPPGQHTFAVRATDSAGNLDATPAEVSFLIDRTAPGVTIDSGPAQYSTIARPAFGFSSAEAGATFECRFDQGEFTPCVTGYAPQADLAEGGHTFSVRAKDAAGNATDPPATQTFTVDTVAPAAAIHTGPAGLTNATSAGFTYSSGESGSTFECSLDGSDFLPCPAAGQDYAGLGDGPHTFRVKAKDAAGNLEVSGASRQWTVDSTPPETTITQAPPAQTTSTSAALAFVSTEAGSTFECALDGAAFASCASPRTVTGLALGAHTFAVRATDAAGNPDASPATVAWTVTPQAPPPAPPVITTVRGPVTVPRSGTFLVAMLRCQTGTCRLLSPKARVTVRGKSFKAFLSPPAAIPAPRTGAIGLTLPAAAMKALAKAGRGRVTLSGTGWSSAGKTARWAVSLALRPPRR